MNVMREFSVRLGDITDRVEVFSTCIKKDRLPSYLRQGKTFMGKFQIEHAVTYRKIFKEGLLSELTSFPAPKTKLNSDSSGAN